MRTTAGRLLISAKGSGGFTPPTPAVETLQAAPSGYGTLVAPVAIYDSTSGKVFITDVNGTSGQDEVFEYVESTHASSTPVAVSSGFTADVHSQPSVIARSSDGKLVSAFSQIEGAAAYINISTNARDATSWAGATDISSQLTSTAHTYMNLVEMSDGIYLVYHDGGGGSTHVAYSKSTDGGVTWATRTQIFSTGAPSTKLYWRMIRDGAKLHFFITDTDRFSAPSSLYHCYLEGGALKKTDGSSAGSPAINPTAATLVKDSTDGPINPFGIAIDAMGQPAASFMVYKSSGPTNQIWTARYRSSAWQCNEVDDTNGLPSGFRYESGTDLEEGSSDICYYSKKVGSHFEAFRAVTGDDGATWTPTQLTSGSTTEALLVMAVRNASHLKAVWRRGTVTNSTTFSAGTEGYRV